MKKLAFIFWMMAAAQAASVYVTLTGNDTTGNGTLGNPYRTVEKGADNANFGDTVLVTGDHSNENPRVTVHGGVTIDGQGTGYARFGTLTNAALLGSVSLEQASLKVINCKIKGGSSPGNSLVYIRQNAHFCVVTNNLIDANADQALIRLVRWEFPATYPGWDTAGCSNTVAYNEIKNAAGEVVFKFYGHHNVMAYNYCHDVDNTDWFHAQGGTNYIIGNTCSNLFFSGANANHADFVQTFWNSGTGTTQVCWNIIIESNLCTRADNVAQLGNLTDDNAPYGSCGRMLLRNNFFIGVAAKASVNMPEVEWSNNFFYQCATNLENGGPILICISNVNGNASGAKIFNNVFLDCGLPPGQAGYTNNGNGWYYVGSSMTNVAADYNYVGKDGYRAIEIDPSHRMVNDPNHDPFAWWEDHGINGGNPSFVNVAALNFHLQAGSFLRDAGATLSGFANDFQNVPRPQGSAWDIGPYEYFAPPARTLSARTVRVGRIVIAP